MNAPPPNRCVDDAELDRLVDGQLSEDRARQVRAHAASCARCRGAVDAVEELVADLRAPLRDVDAEAMVAALLRRIDRDAVVPLDRPRRRRAPVVAAVGAVLVAAAAAIAVVAPRLARSPHDGELAARGAAAPTTLSRATSVTFLAIGVRTRPAPARALVDGAAIPRDTAFAAAYRNLRTSEPTYLLAFGVDAEREVHWLYPAYEDAATDPPSTALPPAFGPTVMPSSVVFDAPASGPLRLVSVLTDRPLHVSDVEALPPAERDAASLRARWPDAVVTETLVTLTP